MFTRASAGAVPACTRPYLRQQLQMVPSLAYLLSRDSDERQMGLLSDPVKQWLRK